MFDTETGQGNRASSPLLLLARHANAFSRPPRRRNSAPGGYDGQPLPREPRPSPLLAVVQGARHEVPDAAAQDWSDAPDSGGNAWESVSREAEKRDAATQAPAWRTAAPEPAFAAVPRGSSGDDDRFWRPMVDPFAVIGTVARAKWLILALTVLGGVLGAVTALSTPKKYEASTELLIDPRDLKLTDSSLTEGGLPYDATLAIVENQARVLTSGTVLTKVVDKLNLAADPEFNGTRGDGGLGALVASLRSALSSDDAVNVGADVRRRVLAIENLGKSITAERGGKTFVVRVGVTTESPEKSSLIANTMTDVFTQTYGELQSDTAGRAAEELTARLANLRQNVEAAERKVEDFKSRNGIVDAQGKLISDEEILKLNDQLAVARARALELDARAASARQVGVDDALGAALPENVNSNMVTELRSQYASLKSQADLLSVRLGPRHPQLLAVQAQLAGAREQLRAELRRIVASMQVDRKRAAELEGSLSARLAQMKVQQGSLSTQLVTLRELERDATAKRSVYEAFLLRARETGEQRGINTANLSVISKASPPLEPVGPSRAVIALTGAILGCLAGIGLAGAAGAVGSLRTNTALRTQPALRRVAPPLEPPPGPDPAPASAPPPALAPAPAESDPPPPSLAALPAQPEPDPAAEAAKPDEATLDELRVALRDLHERVQSLARSRAAAKAG